MAAKANSAVLLVLVLVLVLGMLVMLAPMMMMAGAQPTTCQTGSGSPTVGDANTCVQYIRGLGASTQCCQQLSPSGSCTKMCTSGSAAVDICGDTNACTTCADAGDQLNIILATCPSTAGLVQGTRSASGFVFRIRHS